MVADTHILRQIPALKTVIVLEEGVYVAHCVEYDIAAHGQTVEEACARFVEAVIKHVLVAEQHGEHPFGARHAALGEYRDVWNRAIDASHAVQKLAIPSFRVQRKRGAVTELQSASVDAVVAV